MVLSGGDMYGGVPVYTYSFVKGVAESSHGLLVARMAGIPGGIVKAAKDLLRCTKAYCRS